MIKLNRRILAIAMLAVSAGINAEDELLRYGDFE